MKNENLICPFCKSQIDELSRDKLELIKKFIFFNILPAILHMLKNTHGSLHFYIMDMIESIEENQTIINEKYLPKFKLIFSGIEKHSKKIYTYINSLMSLFRRSFLNSEGPTNPVKKLPDEINSILEFYRCDVNTDYSSFEKKELFINIHDYITVFALVLNDALLRIGRARSPQIDISFAFEESNLRTVFEISHLEENLRSQKNLRETTGAWNWAKYATEIVEGKFSINEDNGKTIVIFDIPFVNKEKNVDEET